LEIFAGSTRKPWLLPGDFNETRSLDERDHGGGDMARRCSRFNNWVEINGLVDLGNSGPRFTWVRGNAEATRKSTRLDRALCNIDWRAEFQEGAVQHLIWDQSDHCLLLISTNGFAPLPQSTKPFRFQVAWLSHNKFDEFLIQNWKSRMPMGQALGDLANNLQKWNKEIFGNLFRRKRKLWSQLEGVQKHLAEGAGRHLIKLEAKIRRELDEVLGRIETFWFQKSWMDQIRDGDRNTKYFHLSAIIRRRANRVEKLQDDHGLWVTDQEHIKQIVAEFFSNLYTNLAADFQRNDLLTGRFLRLENDQLEELSKPYSNMQVLQALKFMNSYKAPGPDGYQALFSKNIGPLWVLM